MKFTALVLFLLIFIGGGHARSQDLKLLPDFGPIKMDGSFGFSTSESGPKKRKKRIEKLRRSVSGIACTRVDLCLLVFDEGNEARMVKVDKSNMMTAMDLSVPLMDIDGEIDAEAAATDGKQIFVAGSHSVKRNKCVVNDKSRVVLRSTLDKRGFPTSFQVSSLWDIIGQSELHTSLGRCLGEGGLNIEAMSFSDGKLWFGMRGPVRDGQAPILSLDAEALFDDGETEVVVDWVNVGVGRGLRDMIANPKGGFLLLAGPDDDPRNKFETWMFLNWAGGGQPAEALALLDLSGISRRKDLDGCDDDKDPEDRKPEAIHLDASNSDRVLVLSDGSCDGGAMWFSLPKKSE